MIKNKKVDTRKKDISNITSIVLSVTTFPFIFIFYFFSNKILGLLAIPLSVGYLFTISLNKQEHPNLARFNLITWASLALLVYGSFLGKNSNVISVYASFLFLPIVLFYPNEIKNRIIGISIVLSSMLALKGIYILNIIPESSQLASIGEIIWLVSYILILTFLFILSKEQIKYERKLTKSYDENILLVNEKNQTEIKTLKKLITTLNHHINNLLVPITTSASIAQNKIEDGSLKKMLGKVSENAFEISTVIKKISNIETIKEKEYSDGSIMIDIDSSIKDHSTIVKKN